MRYIIFDQVKNSDLFTMEFNNRQLAIESAKKWWKNLSEYDKSRREYFAVLESENPDENAENHFDGNCILVLK